MPMLEKITPYAKAIVGFIAPGAVILTSSVTSGSDGGTLVTAAEWVTAACACIITAAAVYAVPNSKVVVEESVTLPTYDPKFD